MSETPDTDQPIVPDDQSTIQESPPDEVAETDRLFGAFAIGIMALLLICVVLVVIASRNVPAGL